VGTFRPIEQTFEYHDSQVLRPLVLIVLLRMPRPEFVLTNLRWKSRQFDDATRIVKCFANVVNFKRPSIQLRL
jgi:hypothetical protein